MSARNNAGHRNQTVTVFALDGRRNLAFHHRTQIADTDTDAGRVIDDDIFNILDAATEFRSITDTDVVFLAILPEVGGRRTAHRSAESRCRRRRGQSRFGQLATVEIDQIFRRILVAAQHDLRKGRIGQHLFPHLAGDLFRRGEIVTVNFQLHRCRPGHPHAFGHRIAVQLGEEGQIGTDNIGNLKAGTLTLFLTAQVDVVRNQVGTVVLHTGKGVVRISLTEPVAHHFNFRHIRLNLLVDTGRHVTGYILRRTDGQFCRYLQTALVGLRKEFRFHIGNIQEHDAHKNSHGTQEDQTLVFHAPCNDPGIALRNHLQEPVDGIENQMVQFSAVILIGQQDGTHHRHQRQGRCRRNDHDNAHDPAQLLEHDARHTGNHRQRDEHAQHRERRGDNRNTHFGSTVYGSFLGFFAPFQVGSHVLQNHDSIVHHHTDGNGQSRHRYDIQRITRRQQVHQRSQQGNRDTQHHNEGTSPAAQEDIHHQHHHQEGNQNGFLQGVDGVDDMVRRVHDRYKGEIGRKGFFDVLHRLLHIADHLYGIVSGLLLDDNLGTPDTVRIGFLRFFLQPVIHAGYIAQVHVAA